MTHKRHAIGHLLERIKYLSSEKRRQTVDVIVSIAGGKVPDTLMMRSEQILQLRNAGMEIGAHTCSHPILQNVADGHSLWEITSSKAVLEALLGEPIRLFAYPNGKPDSDYSAKHVLMVKKAGFVAAVSTTPGVAWHMSDPFQLPRFTPWDRTRMRYGLRMLGNLQTKIPPNPACPEARGVQRFPICCVVDRCRRAQLPPRPF